MGLERVSTRLREVPWAALAECRRELPPTLMDVLNGSRVERVLDRSLRGRPDWKAEQRRAFSEAVYGVSLWRLRLQWHVGENAPVMVLVLSLLRDVARLPVGDVVKWLGLNAADVPPEKPAPTDLETRWSYPGWMVDSLRQVVPASELETLLATLNMPAPVTFRVNTTRVSRDSALAGLRSAGVEASLAPYARTALRVAEGARPNVLGLELHRRGALEVQDEGSQLVGLLLGAQPGETILDLCAGAGGKSLLLAAELQNRGTVLAYDSDRERLQRLRSRATKAGASCIRVLLPPALPADLQVDRVLVDAPCSELGALRRGPDARFTANADLLKKLPKIQDGLLDQAVSVLKPGGTLVYATCTLRFEENEGVVRTFEARHPTVRRVAPGEGWLHPSLTRNGYFLSLPYVHSMDGFFAAVYRKDR